MLDPENTIKLQQIQFLSKTINWTKQTYLKLARKCLFVNSLKSSINKKLRNIKLNKKNINQTKKRKKENFAYIAI